MTYFSEVYNRFLGKITDDMYMELTPLDTLRDLKNLLVDAIPNYEFPDKNLYDYTISTNTILRSELTDTDYAIYDIDENNVLVDNSHFSFDLTPEEMNILAVLMMQNWLQRQITSIENIRMKYSGSDFKMTSQANHLSKLITLLDKVKQESLHVQRLYHRRKLTNGTYSSNWSILRKSSALDDQ